MRVKINFKILFGFVFKHSLGFSQSDKAAELAISSLTPCINFAKDCLRSLSPHLHPRHRLQLSSHPSRPGKGQKSVSLFDIFGYEKK